MNPVGPTSSRVPSEAGSLPDKRDSQLDKALSAVEESISNAFNEVKKFFTSLGKTMQDSTDAVHGKHTTTEGVEYRYLNGLLKILKKPDGTSDERAQSIARSHQENYQKELRKKGPIEKKINEIFLKVKGHLDKFFNALKKFSEAHDRIASFPRGGQNSYRWVQRS